MAGSSGAAPRFGPETDFSYGALWEAMEAERKARGLSTNAMLKELAWFSRGVLNAIRDGKGTTCQHIMGPLRWLNRSPEGFTPGCMDSPETALPDFGTRAIRWSLPQLHEATDTKRLELGLSWDEAAGELAWPAESLKSFGQLKYGIPMIMAMRLTRWVGRPAASFLYAAEPHKTYKPPLTRPAQ